ncbi:MAG: sulfotransferase domain-containing protein [Planctomycetes bacterium]|nr:sulfotransferase domain-containing protein [Planctomycetota bacterium]
MSSKTEFTFPERVAYQLKRIAGLGARPNFLIIGGQKCASTALYWNLTQHPGVLAARKKEPNYFSYRYGKGWRWYKSNFPSVFSVAYRKTILRQAVMVGEATTFYLSHPHAPSRVKERLPEIRLIAVLRNPIERAFSHYHHNMRKGSESLSFEEALDREEERLEAERATAEQDPYFRKSALHYFTYQTRGRYAEHLEAWYAHFKKEQILVVSSEAYRDRPAETMQRVCAHLNLPAFDGFKHDRLNVGSYKDRMKPETRERLAAYFRPHNERLYRLLGEDYGWA